MTLNHTTDMDDARRSPRPLRRTKIAAGMTIALAMATSSAAQQNGPVAKPMQSVTNLGGLCTAEAVQAVASTLSTGVTVKKIENGPFQSATKFVEAKGVTPAYCQVTGSFVTNPKTGKTANFLATFPADWNGKYLQSGCSGHCGQFYVSNPGLPPITVTSQGYPEQIIDKGYAHFATDEGHVGMDGGKWAVRKDGTVDQDFIDDFLYRADLVLADMGKAFTKGFYGRANGAPAKLTRSYFNGCSGGGRDALVASSYFPEKFDGIIAGSAYNILGVAMHSSGIGVLASQPPKGIVSAAQLSYLDGIVKSQCDGLDGVKDGVIQNPAACNFRPERDLPKCDGDTPGGQCFTKAQVNMLSTILTGVTDEKGNVLQPGYSVSELQVGGGPGLAGLGDAVQKIFVHRNDPGFAIASNYTFKDGGPGQVTGYRAVFPAAEAERIKSAIRQGMGHLPENTGRLMKSKTKLLMWHNWSDEALTPYNSINYYKRMAKDHGGYAKVQKKARLFMIPATSHCSISGIGPNSFDALSTMENWVEKGQAPDALKANVAARQFTPGAKPAAALQFPNWTQTLCKFPEMARYSGQGDVKDASNWSCSAKDKRLLTVGETGRQAGVLD
ncbi:tannase/feruloyl esterase family alpha/beta hydrolase [Sphingobium boeckii]|uniref:Feruloyl esterase n=1 Tax=Sphingobium boeckii TaxID=1082345 RepID=A0A7W9EE61_9SPHN|nr:tannase/feruloyl esterase family alpha/beta hydrolase [Sphingobium boeckii]MBB5685938.1 feruloyl esterase [Sphingobium boeckii]